MSHLRLVTGIRRMAVVPWGIAIEDFLDTLGLTIDDYCERMTGSWVFAYVQALRLAGIESTLFLFSREARVVSRRIHLPTGTPISIIPVAIPYRLARSLAGRRPSDAQGQPLGGSHDSGPTRVGAGRRLAQFLSTPALRFARELRNERCDALLLQDYEYIRFDTCALLGRLTGLPVYATFQGGATPPPSRIERAIRKRAILSAEGLIIGPRTEAERVRDRYGVPASRVARIPNPVHFPKVPLDARSRLRSELGIPAKAAVAVWHGRVEFQTKGLDRLLEAWRLVTARQGDDYQLLLIGYGNDSDRLRSALDSGAVRSVTWVDRFIHDRNSVFALLSAGDVYVFPSRHEGFPVAPIEAMGAGLPIVAFDASGTEEIVSAGASSTGVIVPGGDVPLFAENVRLLLDDPGRARELGIRARHKAMAEFSLEAVAHSFSEFFQRDTLASGSVRTKDSELLTKPSLPT
jgi:glycosyltransferase involved in cell wall biosynthesis